jgi:hypothetical protein
MVDSNLVTAKDYEIYMSKFLLEARQELKRQTISEKESAIKKAEDQKKQVKASSLYRTSEEDKGNEDLITYATLLLPFRDTNPAVNDLLKKMLSSNDKRLKYNTAYLFIRHKIPVHDSVLSFFASLDEFRYELFSDMKEYKALHKFPVSDKKQQDIARSKLYSSANDKPDSLVFIDSLPVTLKDSKGFVFFYKYKTKKDDSFWKLATVSLLSKDGNLFNYDNDEKDGSSYYISDLFKSDDDDGEAQFTDEKIKEETSIKEQMEKQVKKIIYSKRKSAAMFYNEESDYSDITRRYLD